jgi:ferredoxin--NADP+ reductase
MHKVIERKRLVPNIHLLRVSAPDVARKVEPGNFVIVKIDETAERIPLTVADWNKDDGTLSIVFMTVGASTHRLAQLKAGDEIETCVGPLGRPMEVGKFGTVVCMAGCYGIGAILPVALSLKKAGNKVIMILEAKTKDLVYWREKYEEFADKVILATLEDVAEGKNRIVESVQDLVKAGEKIDRVIALGCSLMMMRSSEATRDHKIKTIVSLNPVMIDGTGMCGVCRCSVGGKTKFACVDGPDFDGHEVDWKQLFSRRRSYLEEEMRALSEFECRICG